MPAVYGIPREAIAAALFARLQGAYAWATVSRRFRDVNDVGAKEQPAAFLLSGDSEGVTYSQEGLPGVWEEEPAIFIYARTDDKSVAPATVINTLTTAVEAALVWQPADQSMPAPGAPTTLGGLVTHCRIAGIRKGEGAESGQAVIVIHLHLLKAGA